LINKPSISRSLLRTVHSSRRSRSRTAIPVIVHFAGNDHRTHTKHASSLKRKLNRCKHHFIDKGHLWAVGGWAARVSPACLKTIRSHKGVAKIVPDRKNIIKLNVATPSIGSASVQLSGRTGRGITIAVLDTGVAPHPDLTRPVNRIAAFKDFIQGRTKPYDDNGHGTHVCGNAAGNGFSSSGKYKGSAPKANIVGVKVLDQVGSGFDSTIIQGIQWCIANRKKYGIRILNMSFGKPATVTYKDDPLCQAIGRAVRAGLIVTVAAGNEGPGKGTVTSPGISPAVITVGAVNDRRTIRQRDDRIAGFSSRGPAKGGLTKPDVVAPGVGIVSLRAEGSLLDRSFPPGKLNKAYMRLSGTSFSSPITAGAIAQMLQKNPRLGPSRIKQLIKGNAYSLRLPSNTQGKGALNVRFINRSR
jgi:serine protease AprX